KKGKYVYYHCSGTKGKCTEKYVREEELARQFGEAVRAIQVDRDVAEWMVLALKESQADKKQFHLDAIKRLQSEYQRMADRLEIMYDDKLDGVITPEMFTKKREEYRSRMDRL